MSERDETRAIGWEYKINNGKEVNDMNIKMTIRAYVCQRRKK